MSRVRLVDLEPQLVRAMSAQTYEEVDTLAEASGVRFLCPVCFHKNGGAIGTHGVLVWFRDRGVPDALPPGPGRWAVSGTSIADLTLAPSIHLTTAACGWHGFVTAGYVT